MEAAAFLGVEKSVTGRRWRARAADEAVVRALTHGLGLPDLLARVLAGRGVSPDAAADHLNPTLKAFLPDPSGLRDMDRAAERLAEAILAGERVAVFGDYDVDGATSAALLRRYFQALGRPLTIYVPDRMREGYGPNARALEALGRDGHRLILTVDCGIAAHEPLAAARAAGLDVIVVDHHLPGPDLPPCLAVVNPNRADDISGQGVMAAVGVTFLLTVAVNRALRARDGFARLGVAEPDLRRLLDIVALGTVADVVPLTGVNRAFVAQGLKVLERTDKTGLSALMRVAGIDQVPGVYHLGFMLGPRVNAGGRVGRSDLGARLLSTDDPGEAEALAMELDRLNRERQAIEALVLDEALAEAQAQVAAEGGPGPLVLVAREGWHAGVIGIVASRLKDRFQRPAVVIALENGVGKGSGRSVPGVNLGDLVHRAAEAGLLMAGGGHAMAAGLTVSADRLGDLKSFMTEALMAGTGPARFDLDLDGALAPGGAHADLCASLERAGPFGAGNPEPRLAVPQARVVRADVVGQRHVRCVLTGPQGGRLDAIAFRATEGPLGATLLSATGRDLHLAGALRAEVWQGRTRVQLQIEDAAMP